MSTTTSTRQANQPASGRPGAGRPPVGWRAGAPIGEGAAAVEAWFADAGLPVLVVDRCPHPGCRVCGRRYPDAA